MKRILVIDNYDSFTYNIVHCIEKLTGSRPDVFRNDEIKVNEIREYDKVVLSPGPGIPEEAGICLDVLRTWSAEKSILGVCLGHQAIGVAFGAHLVNLDNVFHGVATSVNIIEQKDPLFRKLPSSIVAGRYHSWVVSRDSIPDCLNITCVDDNNIIMGISHRSYDVKGLQFHPESVLTEKGLQIISNWLAI
jgi:anthranilate synthase component 2